MKYSKAVLAIGVSALAILSVFCIKQSFLLSGDIKVQSEKEESRGTIKFGYGASKLGDGVWSEAPDGIKEISMETKLIKDFTQKSADHYFLAYQYFVQLIPQEKKKSANNTYADIKGSPIAAYCVEFDFFSSFSSIGLNSESVCGIILKRILNV